MHVSDLMLKSKSRDFQSNMWLVVLMNIRHEIKFKKAHGENTLLMLLVLNCSTCFINVVKMTSIS